MGKLQKRLTAAVLAITAFAAAFRAGVAAGAQNGTPGSISDPLITKSYLDEKLAQLEDGGASGGMVRLELSKGDTVSGEEGTLFVLIEGSAFAGGDGMVDITRGEAVNAGMSVSKYNTFLASEDGGAVLADSRAVVFVSGNYSVAKASD